MYMYKLPKLIHNFKGRYVFLKIEPRYKLNKSVVKCNFLWNPLCPNPKLIEKYTPTFEYPIEHDVNEILHSKNYC